MSSRYTRIAGGFLCGMLAPLGAIAQTSADLQAPTGNRYVAIGCVSRETPPPSGRGMAAPSVFVITDNRGETPLVYRLEGDESQLTVHVGHTIQVEGPLTPPPPGATGPSAKAMVMKISSLVYLSPSCRKPA